MSNVKLFYIAMTKAVSENSLTYCVTTVGKYTACGYYEPRASTSAPVKDVTACKEKESDRLYSITFVQD